MQAPKPQALFQCAFLVVEDRPSMHCQYVLHEGTEEGKLLMTAEFDKLYAPPLLLPRASTPPFLQSFCCSDGTSPKPAQRVRVRCLYAIKQLLYLYSVCHQRSLRGDLAKEYDRENGV